MELTIAKVTTAVVLLGLTLIFSFIPYAIVLQSPATAASSGRRARIIAYLNCFAGGVFLGTLLTHILAEGSEEFDEYKDLVGLDTDFPLFNLLVAAGFFMVAFVELAAHAQMHKGQQVVQRASVNRESDNIMAGGVGSPQPSNGQYGAISASERVRTNSGELNGKTHGAKEDVMATTESIMESDTSAPSSQESGHSHDPHSVTQARMRAFLLLVALSFHTIFDGLAVGLQKDVAEVWTVFAAITVHKSIISFCLGLELFQSSMEKPWRAIVWLVFFALMSPLGIGIGIGLTSGGVNERDKLLASSILQGLAAGTFLYVTFLEILCEYIGHKGQGKFTHVLTALAGFAVMAASKLFDKD